MRLVYAITEDEKFLINHLIFQNIFWKHQTLTISDLPEISVIETL
jgi:hypothetical protein